MRRLLPIVLLIGCANPDAPLAPSNDVLVARAVEPSVEDLGVAAQLTINGGPGITMGSRINDDGFIAGRAEDRRLVRRPFEWREGTFKWITLPSDRNADQTIPLAISKSTHIVGGAPGWDDQPDEYVQPFRWHGEHTDVLSSVVGVGYGVNRQGVVAGTAWASAACCETRAFLWGFPAVTWIPELVSATQINDGGFVLGRDHAGRTVIWKGRIVRSLPDGFYGTVMNEQQMVLGELGGEASLWSAGALIPVRVNDAPVQAYALATNGTVIGSANEAPIAWCKGVTIELPRPDGSTSASAASVSPNGKWVVGYALFPGQPWVQVHLVRWTLPAVPGRPGPRC